jgi:hypothetical protein
MGLEESKQLPAGRKDLRARAKETGIERKHPGAGSKERLGCQLS